MKVHARQLAPLPVHKLRMKLRSGGTAYGKMLGDRGVTGESENDSKIPGFRLCCSCELRARAGSAYRPTGRGYRKRLQA